MSRAKFSWEPLQGGSLLLRVTQDEKDTTWKITKRTTAERLITILWEVQEAMAQPLVLPDGITDIAFGPDRIIRTSNPQSITSGGNEYASAYQDQVSEEQSKAALAAKAKGVTMTPGGNWFDNIDESDDDLPMYTIGHGEEES